MADDPADPMNEYDRENADNAVFSHYRDISVKNLLAVFQPGDVVLDIGCGTGDEAIELARHGINVLAIDASAEQLKWAEKKVMDEMLDDLVELKKLSAVEIDVLVKAYGEEHFNGAYASFGVLNCLPSLNRFSTDLRMLLEPGACFLASIMNKVSLWEIPAYLLRGDASKAFRRLRTQLVFMAGVTEQQFSVTYYTELELKEIFENDFLIEDIRSYPLLPPPFLNQLFVKLQGYLDWAVERHGGMLNKYGDHLFVRMRRK